MTLAQLWWRANLFGRRIWVRIALVSLAGLATAAVAGPLGALAQDRFAFEIGEAAVSRLLSILSNSMLVVSTFSLSVMVAAHNAAAAQASPRVHRLLRQDARTQTVLATFIGAFVYALGAVTLVNAGMIRGDQFFGLYVATILVIVLVILAILRWVQHLSALGSMEQTIDRVEEATGAAWKSRLATPRLGAAALPPEAERPADRIAVTCDRFGHMQSVDLAALSSAAEDWGARIFVLPDPADWLTPGTPIAEICDHTPSEGDAARIRSAFVVTKLREFSQDPGFGVVVLSEIGQRALSAGINDPHTAITVVHRLHALLWTWRDEAAANPDEDLAHPRIFVRPWEPNRLVGAAFDQIGRDGADRVEVACAVQSSLASLSRHGDGAMRAAALDQAGRALARAEAALTLEADRAAVRAAQPPRAASG